MHIYVPATSRVLKDRGVTKREAGYASTPELHAYCLHCLVPVFATYDAVVVLLPVKATFKLGMKILHVLASLGQGGIEKWLASLATEFKRPNGCDIQFEFLTYFRSGGRYQQELETMGCRIHHCQLSWRNLPRFLLGFARHLRRGQYDLVHCHGDYLSGLILPAARLLGVKGRICHVHAADFSFAARRPWLRHILGRILRRITVLDGGVCVGTSQLAIDCFLGNYKPRMRHLVCPCGIPSSDFAKANAEAKSCIRERLGFPENAKVVLHVGRHSESKNLLFFLDVISEMLVTEPDLICACVGSGPLTGNLEAQADMRGIATSVRFLGSRDDVAQIMSASDLLILPSRNEGLGLVVIEAQAAGLRSLISDVVPEDVELIDNIVVRLPLEIGPHRWALEALRLMTLPTASANECLRIVNESPFSIVNSASAFYDLYQYCTSAYSRE